MKKFVLAAAIASTLFLAGCSDKVDESTITNVVVTAPATIAQLVIGMSVFTGPTFGLDIPIPTTIQSINTTTGEIVLSNFVSVILELHFLPQLLPNLFLK